MANLNSNQFSYNDMSLRLGTQVLFGATGIEVEFGYEHEEVRGKGGKAQAINEKNFSVSGTLSMLQGDLEALIAQHGINYQKKYFQLVWALQNDEGDLKTHIIVGIKLGKTKMALKSGDAFMPIDIPFMALDIKLNQ